MRRTPTFLAATAATGLLAGATTDAGAATGPVPSAEAAAPATDAPATPIAVPGTSAAALARDTTAAARDRLVRRVMRVARKHAAVEGRELRDGFEAAMRTLSTEDLGARHREERRALRGARRDARARERGGAGASVSMPAHLAAIAQCESGGDPAAIGGGGAYRGLFQFSPATWQAVGGSGDPAAAPVAEQVRRAQLLYARAGASQWPVCGR